MAHARSLCIAMALLATATTLVSQAPENGVDPEVIHKDVNEVNLTFTMTDGRGHFITGLSQDNFSILDDQRPPASVNRFQSLTDLPLRICVLIDSSGSVSNYVKFQQEVAIGFLKRILRPGTDQACVVKFANQPAVVQDFTDDLDKLKAGVHTTTAEGLTAVWDALRFTSERMAGVGGPARVRRVIVLISDGDDNDSAANVNDAVQASLRSEVAVEVVDTVKDSNSSQSLRRLATMTGGLLWEGENAKSLSIALAQIEQSLRSEYFVAYQPAGELAPGHFRKIQLKANRRKGKIAYRSGYFVPKPESSVLAARPRVP